MAMATPVFSFTHVVIFKFLLEASGVQAFERIDFFQPGVRDEISTLVMETGLMCKINQSE